LFRNQGAESFQRNFRNLTDLLREIRREAAYVILHTAKEIRGSGAHTPGAAQEEVLGLEYQKCCIFGSRRNAWIEQEYQVIWIIDIWTIDIWIIDIWIRACSRS
jgi:hypothetical protein